MGVRGELYSTKVSSEKRTYFFNVKENRTGDCFLNIVESKKEGEGEFERHQIMVYQEEIELFLREFTKAADVLRKHRDLEQGSRPRPQRSPSFSAPRTHDASSGHAPSSAPRKPRTNKNDREPPKPTFELDGKWQGPESMKAVGGKVARISRKQIEERNANKDQTRPNPGRPPQ